MAKSGWRKRGERYFSNDDQKGLFQAVIFGAPGNRRLWAWGVWSSKRMCEGIQFSLKSARKHANIEISQLFSELTTKLGGG